MSITPEAIDAMIAAGVTREQMAAVIKADLLAQQAALAAADEARKEKARAGNRDRQLRWRNRNNANNAVMVRDERDPSPKDNNQTPNHENYPTDPNGSVAPRGCKTTRKARNRALPADWQPGPKSEACRVDLNRPTAWMHRTGIDMRTWAESKGEVRADWDATHVGWMRREAQRESERPAVRAGPSGRPEKTSAVTAFADRLEARRARHQHQEPNPDHGPFIDHESDGGSDREVHEPVGGQARRFSPEAPVRISGSRWQ